jgi:uncharacterized membrane protein YgdD (TMEM256/DUF423 family)
MSENTFGIKWKADPTDNEEMLEEGKRNVKVGVGLGAFGAGSLALIGTTCPLCFFVAPAMVGVGMWKTRKAKKQMANSYPGGATPP